MELITRFKRLLSEDERRQIRGVMALAVVAGVLQTLAVLSIMPFMGLVADLERGMANPAVAWVSTSFGLETPREILVGAGIAVFTLLLSANLIAALSLRRVHLTAWNINHFLSKRLLSEYLYRPYPWFLERHSGGLSRNLLEEVRIVVQGGLIPLMSAGVRGVEASLLVVLLLLVDPFLTLAAGGLLGGFYLVTYLGVRILQRRLGEIRAGATRTRFQVAVEALGGIKEVKSLGVEAEFIRRFGETGPPFVRSVAWSQILAELPRFLLEVLSLGTVLALVLLLAFSGRSLEEALPVLALFGFAGYKLVPSFHQVFTGVSVASFALPAIKELEADLGDKNASTFSTLEEVVPLRFSREVGLSGVTLRYPGAQEPSLNEVSFQIPIGSRVGIVGPTGAGKTTLVDVLLGLLQPEAGALTVDGEPLSPEDWEGWRKAVGYVPQSIFLADDTVAQNIAFGVRGDRVEMERVRRVSEMAELSSFVESLPDGYDTMVGERGVRLSGGQRQRIGIARALYRDPSLLLLDEATSALDGATEKSVMDAIYGMGEERTVVIIAHRLRTVQACDTILLLERGRLVDQGSFDQLLETNELFRVMARTSERLPGDV